MNVKLHQYFQIILQVCHAFWIISLASYFMREKHNIGEYESQWKMVGKFQEFAQQHKENGK